MPVSPPVEVFFAPSLTRRRPCLTFRRLSPKVWIPVLLGLAAICFESTPLMGGNNTARWFAEIWPKVLGSANSPFVGALHHFLRKLGHFTGYGTLGLLLRKAWSHSVRAYMNMIGSRLMLAATALSVSFTFLVGSLDEWHQSIVPGRISCCRDVLIDTGGALLFNAIFWAIRARKLGAPRRARPRKASAAQGVFA